MISKRGKTSLLVLGLVSSLVVGMLVGFQMEHDDEFFELRKNFRIFGSVYEELVTGYVKPVDPEHLMRVGIEAMLSELDPYTTFLDEADNTNIDIITEGRYGGVGLEVGERGGRMTVIAPMEGATGYQQGIRAGDVLLEINDQSVRDLSIEDVQTLLRGEPGSTVRVRVKRQGVPEPLSFTLTREKIDLENVTYSGVLGESSNVAYVKLERFTRDAAPELRTTLANISDSTDLGGVVLDLRDNPGGLLRAAVSVTELFVKKGAVVVSTEGRLAKANNTYRSDRAPLMPDVPLVVLVNQYSASASEIVAGAIQDHDRGVVLGTTTYGKGLVQAIRSLPHNTSLKMTTAQYQTPSGRSIQPLDGGFPGDSTTARGTEPSAPTVTGAAHETTHGRTVHDGNGLRPDVRVPFGANSPLEEALKRKAAFFYYANEYAATHDQLPQPFTVDDAVFTDFRQWLRDEDIEYRTEAEHAISELEEQVRADTYSEIKDEIAVLREAVRAEKNEGFQKHESELKRHLKREILGRFVSEREKTAALLSDDKQLTAAVDLLREHDRYHDLLTPEQE